MQFYFLVLLIFGAWQFTECGAECNEQNVGTVSCIATDYYQFQWATCLTNKYIQQQSRQDHRCQKENAAYCYYQCSLETRGGEGLLKDYWKYMISSECKCDPLTKPDYTSTPQLPAWCNSPDGTNCSWNQHCLKQRYPSCLEKDKDVYGDAEKFCQAYTNYISSFSGKAEQWMVWMDAARKCMQIALVPYIRPWQKTSCETLKEKAFESHRSCYLNPGPGLNNISYCDLSFTDQMKVFWTIKSRVASTFTPGLKETWNTLLDCLEKSPRSPKTVELCENIELLHLEVDISSNYKYEALEYGKRKEYLGYLTGRVVDEIASRQNWRKKGLVWFAYPASQTSFLDSYYFITIVLVDRYTYEGFASRPSQSVNNTSVALSDMVNGFKNGSLKTIETGTDKVALLEMNQCTDWSCTQFSNRFKDSGPTSAASTLSTVYLASTFLWLAL